MEDETRYETEVMFAERTYFVSLLLYEDYYDLALFQINPEPQEKRLFYLRITDEVATSITQSFAEYKPLLLKFLLKGIFSDDKQVSFGFSFVERADSTIFSPREGSSSKRLIGKTKEVSDKFDDVLVLKIKYHAANDLELDKEFYLSLAQMEFRRDLLRLKDDEIELENSISVLQSTVIELQDKVEMLEKTISSQNQKISIQNDHISNQSGQINTYKEKLHALEQVSAKQKKSILDQENQIKDLKDQLYSNKQDTQSQKSQIDILQTTIETLKSEMRTFRSYRQEIDDLRIRQEDLYESNIVLKHDAKSLHRKKEQLELSQEVVLGELQQLKAAATKKTEFLKFSSIDRSRKLSLVDNSTGLIYSGEKFGWATCIADAEYSNGLHRFLFRLENSGNGNIMLGCIDVSLDVEFNVEKMFVGQTRNSFGIFLYKGVYHNNIPSYPFGDNAFGVQDDDEIEIVLDLDNHTMEVILNGVSKGFAFKGLANGSYCPAVSLYCPMSQVRLEKLES